MSRRPTQTVLQLYGLMYAHTPTQNMLTWPDNLRDRWIDRQRIERETEREIERDKKRQRYMAHRHKIGNTENILRL